MKTIVADGNERAEWQRRMAVILALASLALSMLLSSLGTSIANVALPTLARTFVSSFQGVQWVILAYLLSITVMVVGVGRLGDIYGHRRVLLAGIALFSVASLLCGVAPSLWLLIAARGLQGLGAAVLMALTVAFVRETVPKERTGSAMGLLGTMSAIGTAIGPTLGGALIASPGWRAIFIVMVPLGLVNFILAYRFLPRRKPTPENERTGFDGLGTVLLGLSLAGYALAVTVGGGRFDRLNVALLVVAAVLMGLFALSQARATYPTIRPATLRGAGLRASLVMNALVSTVMMATLVVGPFYLSRTLGLRDAVVGIVMSAGPVVSAFSGVPAGRLVDRLGARFVIIAGLVLLLVGSIALPIVPSTLGIAGYVAAIALLTPGYQLFHAANNTAVMAGARPDQRGVISGLLGLSRNLGLLTGASVMGAVFAMAIGTVDIVSATPAAVAGGMRIAFTVAAVMMGVALAIAAVARRPAQTVAGELIGP